MYKWCLTDLKCQPSVRRDFSKYHVHDPRHKAAMYRDADFDVDDDVRSTTSCFAGLKESHRFLPDARPKVRRASSVDDISRFQRHCGPALTWRHYASMLHDGFRLYRPPKVRSVHTVCSPTSTMSERSVYATAHESEASSSYYSIRKISSDTKHLARELLQRVDRVLHLRSSPSKSPTPTPAPRTTIKRQGLGRDKTASINYGWKSARGGTTTDATSSDSASSSCSIRAPCGAGDSPGTRNKPIPIRIKDKRQQQRRPL